VQTSGPEPVNILTAMDENVVKKENDAEQKAIAFA
jgi:hypothetical protein